MNKQLTRVIKTYDYYRTTKDYIEDVVTNVDYCIDNFKYQVNTDPVAIKKDILSIVSNKYDWYHHHAVIYYNDIGCYVVLYRMKDILVNIYTGPVEKNGYCGLAHQIGKMLNRDF